jgi:hypothetical protein
MQPGSTVRHRGEKHDQRPGYRGHESLQTTCNGFVTIGADELCLEARLECLPHGTVTARLQFCHLDREAGICEVAYATQPDDLYCDACSSTFSRVCFVDGFLCLLARWTASTPSRSGDTRVQLQPFFDECP